MESLAILGTGISGLGAAHFLNKQFNLTIYDNNNYIGGHTNTVYVNEGNEKIPIDTGFIVFNDVTYPNLIRLFKELNVETKNSDMSFSVQYLPDKLEWCGSGWNQLFAQRKNIFSIRFWKLLLQVNRFNSTAYSMIQNDEYNEFTVQEFVERLKFGQDFLDHYLIPMSSAVWSSTYEETLNFPISTLVRFFHNHGFLGLYTQHQWKTVANGSISYVKKIIPPFKDKIKLNSKIKKVSRVENKVCIIHEDNTKEYYDKLIFACHADTAFNLLDKPNPKESQLLSNFKYQKNIATLHTDESIMPKKKLAWSAWNYRVEKDSVTKRSVIYWMNPLQGVSKNKNYFESVNDPDRIQNSHVIKRIEYDHPIFNRNTQIAQERLHELNQDTNIFYCGSYFRYGFHEDAFLSAVNLTKIILGKEHPWS